MEGRSYIPGIKGKVKEAPLGDVVMRAQLRSVDLDELESSTSENVRPLMRKHQKRQKELDEISNPFTYLPKLFGRGLKSLWTFVRRIMSGDGFANVYIDGKAWRLDVKDGWFLDNGMAVERLFHARS